MRPGQSTGTWGDDYEHYRAHPNEYRSVFAEKLAPYAKLDDVDDEFLQRLDWFKKEIDKRADLEGGDATRQKLAADSAEQWVLSYSAYLLGIVPSVLPELPKEAQATLPEFAAARKGYVQRAGAMRADIDKVAARLVTTSPDVSVSTNLGGWINKMGVFNPLPAASTQGVSMRMTSMVPGSRSHSTRTPSPSRST